jgi:lysozyme
VSLRTFFRNWSSMFKGGLFNVIDHDPYSKPANPISDEPRQINQRGIDLIKHFEGCYLEAYKDSVGVWTIGYGHTGLVHRDGTVKAGRKITQAEAEELLRYDLRVFSKRVQGGTTVPLTDDQFAALVSFDFNTGGFLKSTLRKKLNACDYVGAAEEFLKWDKAGGKVLKGLTRRRRSERNLFRGTEFPIEK